MHPTKEGRFLAPLEMLAAQWGLNHAWMRSCHTRAFRNPLRGHLGGVGECLDDHARAVCLEVTLAVSAFAHDFVLGRRGRADDAVGLHAQEVAKVDRHQAATLWARRRGDERFLRKDILRKVLSEKVGWDRGEKEREDGVEVERPERELAREDKTRGDAGQVEEARLALVDAEVVLAHPVFHLEEQ